MSGRKKQTGMTLIENLFGIFLIAVCASIMAATLPVANNSRASADYRNKAIAVGQKEMEAVKSLGYANLVPASVHAAGLIDSTAPAANGMLPFTNVESATWDSPSVVLPGGQGFLRIEQAGLDLRRITVRVDWIERGRARSVVLATLVANL